jgi:proteic killer suppression protein
MGITQGGQSHIAHQGPLDVDRTRIAFPLDDSKQIVYHCTVIKSFGCRETRKIFHRQFSRKFPHDIQQRAFMKLNAIDAATELEDLSLPSSNRLEALKGERKGQWSIRINEQWRICFEWRDGNAEEVEIVNYH